MSVIMTNPLGANWITGRHGRDTGEAGLTARLAQDLRCVEVGAFPGKEADLRLALKTAFGFDLGQGTPQESAENCLCIGPGKYLIPGSTVETVKAAVGAAALAVDQTSGKVKISIDGAATKAVLSKTCPLNLAKFEIGAAAASHFSHLACTYFRRSEEGFDLWLGRSFAESGGHWLLDAGAEFGLEILSGS